MEKDLNERYKKISQALLNRYYGKDSGVIKSFHNTRFWFIYNNLYRRCTSPKNNRYNLYGARGIKCEWDAFKNFFEDMYSSYLEHCEKFGERNTQIDRIDNDGNYCKSNCRWATLIEQQRNTSRTIIVKTKNGNRSLREWSTENGLKYKSVFYHYRYNKKTVEEIYEYFKNKNL